MACQKAPHFHVTSMHQFLPGAQDTNQKAYSFFIVADNPLVIFPLVTYKCF
jgi:hypothetical protein